jgi:hypothetical protein
MMQQLEAKHPNNDEGLERRHVHGLQRQQL